MNHASRRQIRPRPALALAAGRPASWSRRPRRLRGPRPATSAASRPRRRPSSPRSISRAPRPPPGRRPSPGHPRLDAGPDEGSHAAHQRPDRRTGRQDDHPRVLLPRQLRRQRRPRARCCARSRRPRPSGAAAMAALLAGPNEAELRAPARDVHRDPRGHALPRPAHLQRHRDRQPVARVRVGWGIGVGARSSGPGRVHADPVPDGQGVKFELDGEPVTVFSGEGVVLDDTGRPGRLHGQLPAVFVDRPAWGGVLANPMHLVGHGERLRGGVPASSSSTPTAARSPTGRSWRAAAPAAGALRREHPVHRPDAPAGAPSRSTTCRPPDGSVENLTEYPVWLTP